MSPAIDKFPEGSSPTSNNPWEHQERQLEERKDCWRNPSMWMASLSTLMAIFLRPSRTDSNYIWFWRSHLLWSTHAIYFFTCIDFILVLCIDFILVLCITLVFHPSPLVDVFPLSNLYSTYSLAVPVKDPNSVIVAPGSRTTAR